MSVRHKLIWRRAYIDMGDQEGGCVYILSAVLDEKGMISRSRMLAK